MRHMLQFGVCKNAPYVTILGLKCAVCYKKFSVNGLNLYRRFQNIRAMETQKSNDERSYADVQKELETFYTELREKEALQHRKYHYSSEKVAGKMNFWRRLRRFFGRINK